jgi:hypothetical protein
MKRLIKQLLCFIVIATPQTVRGQLGVANVAAARSEHAIPSDEELLALVELAKQKAVFQNLREVSFTSSVEVVPSAGPVRQLDDALQSYVTKEIRGMGLLVLPGTSLARPRINLQVTLIRIADSARSIAFHIELGVVEQVRLNRMTAGDPPAWTYVFRSSGSFAIAARDAELKRKCDELLRALANALQAANESP